MWRTKLELIRLARTRGNKILKWPKKLNNFKTNILVGKLFKRKIIS